MYCIQCGVRLQDNAASCPLCGTPVADVRAEKQPAGNPYSDLYPPREHHGRFLLIGLVTTVMLAACLGCLIFCLRTDGAASWSGYVMMGCALAWVCFVFPLCFRKWKPMVFLPLDFACLAGFLLYICAKNGGNWFLSFAFPVTGLAGLVTVAVVALFRYLRRGKLSWLAGLLILIGLSFMLVEFFQHITFGTPMFVWSLYCVCGFCALGAFLLVASLIPSWRNALRRTFFF